jgi:hypothetical protein
MVISHGVFPVIGVRSIIAGCIGAGTAGAVCEEWHNGGLKDIHALKV